jgi:predicted CoA-binding protein
MKHMNREEALIRGLLRETRTIAVIGASPRPGRHSREVVSYLHQAGYDVIPVRPDRARVEGLPTYATLADCGGAVDLVLIFRRPDAIVAHIREAATKGADAVWLPPGTSSRAAVEEAQRLQLTLVKDRCIIEEHRHGAGALGETSSGHPKKLGVHVRRRTGVVQDTQASDGYVAGGGGGRRGGGGVRAVLDERKMTKRSR